MANQEQVALLQQGSQVWNSWRKEHSEILIDLSNSDLNDTDLSNTNLSNSDLSGANLNRADLSGADLSGADLSGADLSNTNLYRVDFRGADLNRVDFRGADLSSADLKDTDLSYANFGGTDLSGADLSGADLRGTTFLFAQLRGVKLSNINLRGINLNGVDLDGVDLSGVDLGGVDLRGIKLGGVNLNDADLSYADLSLADLSSASLSLANLSYANLRGSNFRDSNLRGSNLRGSDLHDADLSNADLSNADLSNADLRTAQVLNANFSYAILTGACIQDWQLGSSSILDNVKCDYVFRTFDVEKGEFSGRLPVNPENTFVPGEFTQRFQIIASALETIDITFTEGIDWQAFFQSFQELRSNRSEETISIHGMERKGDAFIVRLEVEAQADKASIETEIKQLYANQLAALEAQYEKQLRLQSEEIAHYRQTQSSFLHIVQTMAEKDSISQTFNTTANNVGSIGGSNYGSMTANIGASAAERQNLSGAAREIRDLLDTLAETYNSATSTGQEKLMQELDQETKKHPKWRRALKEGGIELIKVLFAPIGIPLEMARVYLEDK